MKKLIRITTAIVCCLVLVFSAASGAVADGEDIPPADMTLEEILEAMVGQINTLTAQVNSLTAQLNAITNALAPSEVNTDILSQQISDTVLTERYIVKIEYINTCLLEKSIELAERRLALIDKQLEVEKTKLTLGESTQNTIDTLSAQRLGAEQSIAANRETISVKKAYIDNNAKTSGYDFIRNYTVPTVVGERFDYTAAQLQSSLIAQNSTLRQYDDQLSKLYESPDADGLTIEQLNSQRGLYENQLRRAAADKYAEYTSALARYKAADTLRPVLAERLRVLDALYANGEISELACAEQKYAVYEELYNADAANVALMGSVAELELMRQGVMGG